VLVKQAVKKTTRKPVQPTSSHVFMAEKKSEVFRDPFPAALHDPTSDWKEKVPGEYKVAKCGKAGHNIRYNPSLKAAPIGMYKNNVNFYVTLNTGILD